MKIKIGDITKIRTGKLDANVADENGQYPFFTCSKEPLKINTYSYDCECVLVAGNGDLNVKYYNGKFDAYQRTYIIEDDSDGLLFMPYLYCFMESYIDELRKQSIGGVIKYIKLKNLTDALIELPSIEVQRKIVNIIFKSKEIVRRKENEFELLDELVRARFVEMFGNPVIGTEKWPIHTVDNVAEAVDPQPSHRTPPIDPDGIPYVSIKDCDLKSGTIDFKGARKVSKNVLEEHLKRYELHDGDFIIGKIGTVGNPIFVPQRRNYALSANVVLVQPNKSVVRPYFLKYSFESEFVERQFNEAKNSTSQAAFGIQKVRLIRVMNPSLNVQDEFEKFAIEIDKSRLHEQLAVEYVKLLAKDL